MLYLDQPNTGSHAIISPEMALMEGRIRTSSVDDLRLFERAFPMDPQVVIAVSQEVLARRGVDGTMSPGAARTLLSPKEKTDLYFKEILPKVFRADRAGGFIGSLYFVIEGAGDYTVDVRPSGVNVTEGKAADVTSQTTISMPTFQAILRWEALEDSGQIDETRIVTDEERSDELSDDQLEMVAGGKGRGGGGGCGAEGSAGTGCGGEGCGADAGAGSGCGGAACVTAAGAGSACGADGCGAAAGVGTGCAAAACGGAACAAAACAADACGADACAGNACGAAASPGGACGGQACGADFAPGPDVGPCAVNVLPVVPFI